MKDLKQTIYIVIAVAALQAMDFIQLSGESGRQDQLKGIHKTQEKILDMSVRNFHYAKPHKGHVQFCPECFDLRKTTNERTDGRKIKATAEINRAFDRQ